jgi:OmcA/MtrC family decaheme c-type cytochrome
MALLQCGIMLAAAATGLVPSHTNDATVARKLKAKPPAPQYTAQQVEAYLSSDQMLYVRPGLNITVRSVTIPADRRPEVVLSFTDDKNQPLDRLGAVTPGAVSAGFILDWYDAANIDFVAYTTTVQTSPITGVSATQASTDSGGAWTELALGSYKYKFKTVLPANYDSTKTHTLGIYASRNLTDIIGKNYYTNLVYNFRPDGQPVTEKWDAATWATCNQCHDPLMAHGETGREEPRLCVLCHNDTQSLDPDTGNTVNFKVMIHKIHMGSSLPSVEAGHPYIIIGYRQGVNDFSDVVFPQDIRHCTTCHKSPDPDGVTVSQADIWKTEPNRAACGSCHDDVNFDTGANHPAGPQLSDKYCADCHLPVGVTEFDASVTGAHTIPTDSTQLPGLVMQILDVSDTAPGEKPTVTFTLTDAAGDFVAPSSLDRLSFNVGGPTTDYAQDFSESGTSATCNGDTCVYTLTTPIPTDATGTWTISADYYKSVTIDDHTDSGLSVRMCGQNPIFNFIVTDPQPVPRREVVSLEKCNVCHNVLALHGGQRFKVQECVICHNANATDADNRPASANPPESIHLDRMIHRIHTGENLTQPFVIYGYHGSVNNFNEVAFPGDRRDCLKCHVEGSYEVPLPKGVLPTPTLRDWYTPQQPIAAACLGCHDTEYEAAHAYVNTAPFGEACASCHGADDEFSVDKVHAR